MRIQTARTIHDLYTDTGYVIDTHTAVAATVYKKYVSDTQDTKKTVIASTASPFKFARSVMTAIDKKYADMGDFELIDELSLHFRRSRAKSGGGDPHSPGAA